MDLRLGDIRRTIVTCHGAAQDSVRVIAFRIADVVVGAFVEALPVVLPSTLKWYTFEATMVAACGLSMLFNLLGRGVAAAF